MARSVNQAAITIAERSEGCVLHAYRDTAGVLTIGWGHTGPDVKPGMVVTQAQADAWRAADMARAAAFVEAHVKVPLTDNQFSTLAEFTYNVGVGNFLGSTLLRLLNERQYADVPAQLMRWTKAGGRVLPGLVVRRQKEVALWGASEWVTSQPTVTETIPVPTETSTAKPSAPSVVEKVRAWLHRNAHQMPA